MWEEILWRARGGVNRERFSKTKTVKKRTHRPLNAQQRLFVVSVADPTDARSVAAKARAAGYTPLYGYRLLQRAHIAAAVENDLEGHIRALRARVARVLARLATAAEAGDIGAAALILSATGTIPGPCVHASPDGQGHSSPEAGA